jgi:UPF0755 protein
MAERRTSGDQNTRTPGGSVRVTTSRLVSQRPPRPPRAPKEPREPRSLHPFLRLINGLFTLILLGGFALGAFGVYLNRHVDAQGPLAQNKLVVIPKGEGAQEIAARLEREGAVRDSRTFIAGYSLIKLIGTNPKGVQLKAGDYEIKPGASIRQIVDILNEGRTAQFRLTVREGLTSYQIVELIKAEPNFTGDTASVPPEGSMLPETYNVTRGTSRQAFIDMLQAKQKEFIDKIWAERQENLPFKTQQEALVLASIVEKETGRNDERERVASVFVNRLRQNMRLQSDPTILYGKQLGKVSWGATIFRADIDTKTAHNTYQINGLPPTPICNPGKATIEAALKPAQTKDLYFVADGKGGHVFAETLKDHNANVVKWREVEKQIQARAAAAAQRAVVRNAPGTGEAQAAQPGPVTGDQQQGANGPSTAPQPISAPGPTQAAPAAAGANALAPANRKR